MTDTGSFWDMLASQTKVAGSPLSIPSVGVSSTEPVSLASFKQINKKAYETCLFINTCVRKLELDITIRSTAFWLFHKFAGRVNLDDYDEYIVAMTCIFLAGKLDECLIKMRDVINVAYCTLYPDRPVLQLDSTYTNLVDTLIDFELFLCRTLKFELNYERPQHYLLHYMKSLKDWVKHDDLEKPFCQMAWALLNDCYFTSLCVKVKPDILAVTCCYLAMRVYDVRLEYEDYCGRHWWKVFVDDIRLEDIEVLSIQILELYEYNQQSRHQHKEQTILHL